MESKKERISEILCQQMELCWQRRAKKLNLTTEDINPV